jgi:hypothetical protein
LENAEKNVPQRRNGKINDRDNGKRKERIPFGIVSQKQERRDSGDARQNLPDYNPIF